jgi:predicted DNA-binding protein with PD1-like motif
MKHRRFNDKIVVRIDKGEDIISSIKAVCKEYQVKAGSLFGIGAVGKITIGLFNTNIKQYHSRELVGDYELAPLAGNIMTKNGEPYIHLHANVCNADQTSFGGHVLAAVVSITCELVIDIIDGTIERTFDSDIGVNTIDL